MTRARCFLATILLAIVPGLLPAQSKDYLRTNPKFIAAFREVVEPHRASTVRIRCDGKEVCLGIIVDADGWVLTKAHDLHGKIECKFADGQTKVARIIGVHEL